MQTDDTLSLTLPAELSRSRRKTKPPRDKRQLWYVAIFAFFAVLNLSITTVDPPVPSDFGCVVSSAGAALLSHAHYLAWSGGVPWPHTQSPFGISGQDKAGFALMIVGVVLVWTLP